MPEQSMEALVRQRMKKSKIGFAAAYEEVVADSMEAMFADPDILDKLQKLKAQDRNLVNRIKAFVDKWTAKLREFYHGNEYITREGEMAAQLKNFERLRELFAEALVDAGENYQRAEKSTTDDGGVKYSERYLAADTNSEILALVNRVSNGEFKASEKVYLGTVSDTIADQINKLTGINVHGFKVAIEARQIDHILKDHGKNGDSDHSMADPGDIAKMEYALSNPDDIRKAGKTQAYTYMRNGRNRTADTVLYEKEIGEKSYYVVQAVPDTKAKTLYIVTAFIGQKGYKKEAPQLINAKSLDATAKTGSANASMFSIRNDGDIVKKKSLTPGEEGVVTNQNGDPVAYSTEDGSVMLSMRTYEEDGRDTFRKYLEKCVSSRKLTKTEMQEMLDGIEDIYQTCKEFKDKYAPFSAWSDAAVVRDTYGRPVFSVVTPNGDYKMNLDFSLVCKKRRTLDAVFNEMSRRGIIDDFELGQKSVVKINEIIRRHGFETACALCFVDAKRFRQASMADAFTNLYNELVQSLVPEDQRSSIEHFNFGGYETIKKVNDGIHTWDTSKLDFSHLDEVMKNYENGTVEYKAAKYIKSHPEGRKLLLRGDFMSSKGFDAVKTQNRDILKLYNSKKGTGGPKAAFGDVQYLNEIIKKARTWTPKKAYEVGGVRIQSFSDYVPRMVFDYVQMIYDLAATKLPAHAYSKEALFVKQFGLTGIKINMSLIPAIAEGGIAPGLDANGNYVWAGESFDFEIAKQIQNAEGYTENCGTICVGVSDEHIRKLLQDPDIRMVIPYHKSGLNSIVAHMNKIAAFTDYTSPKTNPGGCQNTIDKDGSKVKNDFNFNKVLKETGNPKATVRQYLNWCAEHSYTPRFAEFAWHENYYKLIEDFTLYDKDGNYVPQREVRAVFPTADSAFGSMKDLIREGLQEDAVIEGRRDSNLSSIVDEIEQTLPRSKAEIAETEVEQADRDLEEDAKYSLRDVEIPTRSELDKKKPIKVIDISVSQTKGRFAERRKEILKRAKDIISKPYLNKDTNTLIFLTPSSYTHAFNNLGELQLNAAEHLPELVENAVLTHAEPPTHGSEYTDRVYTFFAAAKANRIMPVKLKVKEYNYVGQLLPQNIRAYFENNPREYAMSYDTVVLELEEIEESPSGSARDNMKNDVDPGPEEFLTIKIAELLNLVKGDAEKYIPKFSDRDTDSISNRSLLANAFDTIITNPVEKQKLEEYRQNIQMLNEQEEKLRELRGQIKELSFAKGPRDKEKLSQLKQEATKTANRISTLDGRLLRFEASAPLQSVLQREKQKAAQRQKQKDAADGIL